MGAIGFLLCALGTPCIYYGTEQGFEGRGSDNAMREAMFDRDTSGRNLLNPECTIYRAIAAIAHAMRDTAELRFGRMYYREISDDGEHFGLPYGSDYTLAFSRVLWGSEVLVAYNVSSRPRSDCVIVDASFHAPGGTITMTYLYGGNGSIAVQGAASGARYVKLDLEPHQFVVLR